MNPVGTEKGFKNRLLLFTESELAEQNRLLAMGGYSPVEFGDKLFGAVIVENKSFGPEWSLED